MGEWDSDNSFSEEYDQTGKSGNTSVVAGKLHVLMTVICLLVVAAVSFGIAWLMKDQVRNFLQMGLTFAAPFAAVMGSALLVEYKTNRMTPTCSRKAQVLFALATVFAAFVIGCLTEVLHQPVIIERYEPEYDYVIVQDKSASMSGEMDRTCRKALHGLIDNMEDQNQVGLVAFGTDVVGKVNVKELDEEQRKRIGKVIDQELDIGTGFGAAMKEAMRIVNSMSNRIRPVRIVLVTDGTSGTGNFDEFIHWAKAINKDSKQQKVEFCAIQIGAPMLKMVKDAVEQVGGQIFDQTDPAELAEKLVSLKSTLIIPERVDTLKATFDGKTADGNPNTPYVILTGVMLFLQGLLCGLSLMIMFSLHGQFRFQVILSALMGICAFLLLNYGRYLSVLPAWVCEGLAFSLFGLVFMRENGLNEGSRNKRKIAANRPSPDSYNDTDDF